MLLISSALLFRDGMSYERFCVLSIAAAIRCGGFFAKIGGILSVDNPYMFRVGNGGTIVNNRPAR